MKLRRDILLFGALALIAMAGGWWLLANRPGAAVDTFKAEAKRRAEAARPTPARADAFRATVCADRACVAVEAGGLTFLVGAGEGAAEGLSALGLLRPEMDAVLLTDLGIATVEGLPGLAAALRRSGRRAPLKVFGPGGVVPVVDGANLLASGGEAVRLQAGQEGEDQGLAGRVVFDSGVVAVRAFGAKGRTYRFDFAGRSLVVSGCASEEPDISWAARGTQTVAGMLAAGSSELSPASTCLDVEALHRAAEAGKMKPVLVVASDPPVAAPAAAAAWKEVVAALGPGLSVNGGGGASLDLTDGIALVRETR